MNRRLLWLMLREELRLNTSFTSGRGFYFFPVMVFAAGVLSVTMGARLVSEVGRDDLIHGAHFSLLGYGFFAGGLAFFGGEFLERIFGQFGLIIGLPVTQPLPHRRALGLYFFKEIVFYTSFTLLPLAAGVAMALPWSSATVPEAAGVMVGLGSSFLLGLAAAFLLAALYRLSFHGTLACGIIMMSLVGTSMWQAWGTPGARWNLGDGFAWLALALLASGLLALAAILLIGEHHEPRLPPVLGYRERFDQMRRRYRWSRRWTIPAVVAKERLDLLRSRTGSRMFFSFIVPLSMLVFINWFLDRGTALDIEFNTVFYGVMVGFFGTMIYSWLNAMDPPAFYATLPLTVPQVVRARLLLFLAVTWWIPPAYLGLIAWRSDEVALLPIGLVVMAVVALYIVIYTASVTGLRPNKALFDTWVLVRFFIVSVLPLTLVTLLSMTLEQERSLVLMALSALCASLLLLTVWFYRSIEMRWRDEAFI